MLGNSSAHDVSHIGFERFTVDGAEARSLRDLNATLNAFASDVTFGED